MLSWISGSSGSSEPVQRQCSLSGYLYKMKRHQKLLVPQWTKRWFSIEGKFLRWYETSATEESSGSIDLKRISYISRFEIQGAFSFIIGYPDRNLMIRADSLDCMDKWIRALQQQADIARGGNGMNMISSSPTSPTARIRTAARKKKSSLEDELDRSLRQLQDLERQIRLRKDDVSPSVSLGTIDRIERSSIEHFISTQRDDGKSLRACDNRVLSDVRGLGSSSTSSDRRKSSKDSKDTMKSEIDRYDEPILDYSSYPNLDEDAPKMISGDIVVDVVNKTIYDSLQKTASNPSSYRRSGGAGPVAMATSIMYSGFPLKNNHSEISRDDSLDSLEDVIERPIRRVSSKSRSRVNSHDESHSARTTASTATVSTHSSSSRYPSGPVSRQSSNTLSRVDRGTSGFTTEEDTYSGRSSIGSYNSPNPLANLSSAVLMKKSYDRYDVKTSAAIADDDEVQVVQLHVRQQSRRSSKTNISNDNRSGW